MTKHKRPSTNSGTTGTGTTGDSNSIIKAFSRVKSASIRSMKSYLITDHFNYQKGLFPGGTGSTTCTTGTGSTGTGSIDNSSSQSDVSNYSDLFHSNIRPDAKPDIVGYNPTAMRRKYKHFQKNEIVLWYKAAEHKQKFVKKLNTCNGYISITSQLINRWTSIGFLYQWIYQQKLLCIMIL